MGGVRRAQPDIERIAEAIGIEADERRGRRPEARGRTVIYGACWTSPDFSLAILDSRYAVPCRVLRMGRWRPHTWTDCRHGRLHYSQEQLRLVEQARIVDAGNLDDARRQLAPIPQKQLSGCVAIIESKLQAA
ncbi:hypothetical protein GCM10011612_11030 [Actinomyces gaoshouyii]|uniref:Uncharacterized protein n=1 Tax=Actinomyces gaoshouyii TaxID=1960083 RepID=A0A8H9H909_9ACTO|nr:hypothetical protein GCM10011612_11030 [Actinomyces gaoshouyii]